MKKRTKVVVIVAAITLLLTTVSAMAMSVGTFINPLTKSKSGFVFNGQQSAYSIAGDGYGNPFGYIPPSAVPTPIPTPTPVSPAATLTPAPTPAVSSAYGSFTGTVKDVKAFLENEQAVPGKYNVLVEDAQGYNTVFIVDASTINVTRSTLKVGGTFTGFYEADQVMTMIYPPQIYANVAVVDAPAGVNVKVDLFDSNLLSKDGTLKLIPGDSTKIVLEDGTPAAQSDLGNNRMVVVYGATAETSPAQTTPDTIIVLNKK